mmetsp:Transcript_18442/g.20609  ORF Transcript_18442/g.20609 Transcript_18442/m.20609 type:complete len:110 (-) Transcript_18442:62-391(-)
MFLTKRQHKGFGILFFIWGLGILIICFMCPFIIEAGVKNHFKTGTDETALSAGLQMTESQRDNYLRYAALLRWITLGAGSLMWVLSGFNIISWKVKEGKEGGEYQRQTI